MKINGNTRIKSDGGDYIVLTDNGYEGLTVYKQYQTVADAMAGLSEATYAPTVLVKLVDIETVER